MWLDLKSCCMAAVMHAHCLAARTAHERFLTPVLLKQAVNVGMASISDARPLDQSDILLCIRSPPPPPPLPRGRVRRRAHVHELSYLCKHTREDRISLGRDVRLVRASNSLAAPGRKLLQQLSLARGAFCQAAPVQKLPRQLRGARSGL